MENRELVAKVEQWLKDLSTALHRLSREREVLRDTRTQLMMGVLSTEQAEANLSRLKQSGDSDGSGLFGRHRRSTALTVCGSSPGCVSWRAFSFPSRRSSSLPTSQRSVRGRV